MNKAMRLLILLITILASSCSSPPANSDDWLPNMEVPEKDFNTVVEIENFSDPPRYYKSGDMLAFVVRNRTSDNIVFENDFNVKIFKRINGGWEPVENKIIYPEGDEILRDEKTYHSVLTLFVVPIMEGITEETTVRIAIIGEVEGKSEKVGAYIDVQYLP